MKIILILLRKLADYATLNTSVVTTLAETVYDLTVRQIELENKMATVDQEMRERLDAASSRVAARLDTLIEKVSRLEADEQGAIDAALLADAQADADALRPSVEYLERLGGSDSAVVPDTDPVPTDSAAVEDAPVIDGPSPVAPSEGPITNESNDVAENDTATDDENGNNTNN